MSGVPSSGGSFRKPPPEGDGTDPPKRKRYWWRFSLASLIIVGVVAAARTCNSFGVSDVPFDVRGLAQVKSVEVHDPGPGGNEIVDELAARVRSRRDHCWRPGHPK